MTLTNYAHYYPFIVWNIWTAYDYEIDNYVIGNGFIFHSLKIGIFSKFIINNNNNDDVNKDKLSQSNKGIFFTVM